MVSSERANVVVRFFMVFSKVLMFDCEVFLNTSTKAEGWRISNLENAE